MGEEWGKHQWGNGSQLYHTGNNDRRQRCDIRSGREQCCWKRHEQPGEVDCQRLFRRTDHSSSTCESNGDCRSDGNFFCRGQWHSTAGLPMAEERRKHRWGHVGHLYYAGNHEYR